MTCYACKSRKGPFILRGEVNLCKDAEACNKRNNWTSYTEWKKSLHED